MSKEAAAMGLEIMKKGQVLLDETKQCQLSKLDGSRYEESRDWIQTN